MSLNSNRNSRLLLTVSFTVFLTTVFAVQAFAADPPLLDTIYLKNGGVLQGKAEEVTENKQRLWLVTTSEGTILKLKRSQVARVQKPSQEQINYRILKDQMVDTIDGHWEMQEWCQQNRLKREREFHLMRIVELDPDHKDARARLNYKDYDGVWVHVDHFMSNQGYIKDGRGTHRLPLAQEMFENREAAEQVVTEWNKKIKNLMTKVQRNDQAARRTLTQIKEPAAVTGLMKVYNNTDEIATKRMIIDVLGQIPAGAAQNALVVIATTTPDNQLSLAERAITVLKQPHFDRASICGTVLHWLRPSPTSTTTDRSKVNRSAWLIGKMEYEPAIRPLIDALNTTHTVPTGAPGGNANVSNNSDGAGLQWGPQATSRLQSFQNQAVLDTLRILAPNANGNFAYDESLWLDWYIRENALGTNQLGRDQ